MNINNIAVIMTSHNRVNKTLECLAALHKQDINPSIRIEIFLVDDGCTDGTGELVSKNYPKVNIIKGDGTLFWNQGMHLAFSEALKKNFDYYIWLNDDTILYPHALLTLLDTHQAVTKKNSIPSIIVGSTQDSKTKQLTYGGYKCHNRLKPLGFTTIEPNKEAVECDTMHGNCVLIPQDVIKKINIIDPVFLHGWGDVDYGLRARKNGCAIWIAPGYLGSCSNNTVIGTWEDSMLPVRIRIQKLRHIKGLYPSDWLVFTKRHAGRMWPIYWAWPYLKIITTSIRSKINDYASTTSNNSSYHNVFISWCAYQRRVESLAQKFDLLPIYYHYSWEEKHKLFKAIAYPIKFIKTIKDLYRNKPKYVFIQLAPTPVLYASAIYCAFTKAKYISDCHNTMIYDSLWIKWPAAKILLLKSIIIVHNEDVLQRAKEIGLPGFVLRDPLPVITPDPEISFISGIDIKSDKYIIIPGSLSVDEPVEELFNAARAIPEILFVFTWFYERLPSELKNKIPPNIKFTGFLEINDFNGLFSNAQAAVVLTTREGTQPSGASEAIAMEIPLVVSRIETTKKMYGDAPIYVDNEASSITNGINTALNQHDECRARLQRLKHDFVIESDSQVATLKEMLKK